MMGTYTVLSPVEYDRRYTAGETIELAADAAAQLLEVGAICEPDDPRAATAGAAPADEAAAGIFEQALTALRAATPAEVREFLRRMSEDPEIRGRVEAAEERRSQLRAAIDGLEEGNEDHWTKSGKPEVRALEAATGLKDVSAAERDDVWAEVKAERKG